MSIFRLHAISVCCRLLPACHYVCIPSFDSGDTDYQWPHRHLAVSVPQVYKDVEDPIIDLDHRRVLAPHEILKCRSRRLDHPKMTSTNAA